MDTQPQIQRTKHDHFVGSSELVESQKDLCGCCDLLLHDVSLHRSIIVVFMR